MMDIKPIGAAARTFLRRVRFAGEPLLAEPDELALAQKCVEAGYLRRVAQGLGCFEMTSEGCSYLDKLARCD